MLKKQETRTRKLCIIKLPISIFSYLQEYLSSLGIVHRDLACRNVLVGEGKVLKITDLGMSRETDEVYVQKTKGRVPLKWMAVESIITREFTSASDVWAYGVVLWEIGTLGIVVYIPAYKFLLHTWSHLVCIIANQIRMKFEVLCTCKWYTRRRVQH